LATPQSCKNHMISNNPMWFKNHSTTFLIITIVRLIHNVSPSQLLY